MTQKKPNTTFEELKNETLANAKFVQRFAEDDDWAFVIKSHALIESAVTTLIVRVLKENRLHTFVKRIPLSDSELGKIVMLKELNLLDNEDRKFIRWFSKLRNQLVHNIENVDFDFNKHYQSLDKNQKKAWKESITSYIHPPESFLKDKPYRWKHLLLICVMKIIVESGVKSFSLVID